MRRFSILSTVLVVAICGVCSAAGIAAQPDKTTSFSTPTHTQTVAAFLAELAVPSPATMSNVPDFCQQPLSSCSCDRLNGWPCSQAGSQHACTTSDGYPSSCTCNSGAWHCLL
jgi:hypothetical protein